MIDAGEFCLPLRVYIEDTDAGGIVYYVNYLKFMERSRTEMLRSLGYDKPAFWSDNQMFVVHSVDVNYRKPAQLDDQLQVSAQIVDLGRAHKDLHLLTNRTLSHVILQADRAYGTVNPLLTGG